MISWLSVMNILTNIAFLAVIAVGLYLIFGLMNIINLAHGDMVMLGAYAVCLLTEAGLNFWISVVAAALIVGLIGGMVERGVVQFLYRSGNLSTLLATWGVSICLQQIMRLIFGPQGKHVNVPITSMVSIGSLDYPAYRLILLAVCALVIIGLYLILKKTRVGLLIRSTMDSPRMAEAMGINTNQVYFMGFALGSALAGLAGGLIAPLVSVSPLMGMSYVTQSFLTVIVGGVQTIFSTVGGAVMIGGTQNFLTNYLDAVQSWMSVLVLVIISIWLRPQGVFSKNDKRF